jgi:XTP/dITP diphosphohydrolase
MKVYFVTVNGYKETEVAEYFAGSGLELQVIKKQIQEILHLDLSVIVRDKALKAYSELRMPCVVEHGGLAIKALNGLPGGLSKVVWDTAGDRVCDFLKDSDPRDAIATSVLGYCDGRRIHVFKAETAGAIAKSSRGAYLFQWDPIFIPNGSSQTYAEMGFPAKKAYSQAAKVWEQFIGHVLAAKP